jgi:transcriptional regulator with XRE-family HTH domain
MENKIIEMNKQGKSIREIAEELNISKSSIHRILNKTVPEVDKNETVPTVPDITVPNNIESVPQDTKTPSTNTPEQIKTDTLKTHKKVRINPDGSYYDENDTYRLPNSRTIGEDILFD